MPLALRAVQPVCLSGHPLEPSADNDFRDISITVCNNTLVSALLQLASLVRHADDIFCDLTEDCQKVLEKADKISCKISSLAHVVDNLDSKSVKIPLGDLKQYTQVSDHHVAKHGFDCYIFTPDNRPQCIKDPYSLSDVSPVKILRSADAFRKDGLSGSALFKLWPIMLREDRVKTPDLNKSRKERRITSFDKNYKPVSKIEKRPRSADVLAFETNIDEEMESTRTQLSKSQPSILVAIDTSGIGFQRMCSFRRSLRSFEYSVPRRKRRNKTLSEVPDDIMKQLNVFERSRKMSQSSYERSKAYSVDNLDMKNDENNDDIFQYLDEIEGQREERMEEARASKESKLMRIIPCRRARSLPRCVKLASRISDSSKFIEQKFHMRSSNSLASTVSLSSTSTGTSSRLSRATKRSSVITDKLKSLVGHHKHRPKSLDLDAIDLIPDRPSNFIHARTPSMPDGLLNSSGSNSSVAMGPGTYYNFDSITLPRVQQKKYDFPWESLPKDWTTSVKLREINKRKREERQSSSGNWSGSSSNRQSMESDHTRSGGMPCSTSQFSLGKDSGRGSPISDRYTTEASSSSGNITSNFTAMDTDTWLQSLAVRAAKRSDVTDNSAASLSRLTKQNILALDMMSPELRQAPQDDEVSSVYSLDQEGFYTSFHNDSGLRRSTTTLADEQGNLSPIKEAHSFVGELSGDTSDSVLQTSEEEKLTESRIPPPLPPRRSSRLHREKAFDSDSSLSSATLISRQNSTTHDSSFSESDQESIYARLKMKTRISSTMYPSWCTVSPSGSDEDNYGLDWRDGQPRIQSEMTPLPLQACTSQVDDVTDKGSNSECMTDRLSSKDTSTFSSNNFDGRPSTTTGKSAFRQSSFEDSTDVDPSSKGTSRKLSLQEGTTLPRSRVMSQKADDDSFEYTKSWPRTSHKAEMSLIPTVGILKTGIRNQNNTKTPKSLNFAPVVNMFDPGTPQGLQVLLPEMSPSPEGPRYQMKDTNTFTSKEGNSYKLAIPMASSDSESDVNTSDVPNKYLPTITITPKSRPGEDKDHSTKARVNLTLLDSQTTRKPMEHVYANVKPIMASSSSTARKVGMMKQASLDSCEIRRTSTVESKYSSLPRNTVVKPQDISGARVQMTTSHSVPESLVNAAYVTMPAEASSAPQNMTDNYDSESISSYSTNDSNMQSSAYESDLSMIHDIKPMANCATLETDPVANVEMVKISTGKRASITSTTSNVEPTTFSTFMGPISNSSPYSSLERSPSLTCPASIPPRVANSDEDGHSSDTSSVSSLGSFKAALIRSPTTTNHYAQNQGKLTSPSPARSNRQYQKPTNGISISGHTSTKQQSPVHSSVSIVSNGHACVDGSQNGPTYVSGSLHNGNTNANDPHINGSPVRYGPLKAESATIHDNAARTSSYRTAMSSSMRNGSYRVATNDQPYVSKMKTTSIPSSRTDSYRAATLEEIANPQVEDFNRSDSYRFAIYNRNGVVQDTSNRSCSYRVAVHDEDDGGHKLLSVAKSLPRSVNGRDVRRMGITDVDQLKTISEEDMNKKNENDRLFATIHASKKRMNIKSEHETNSPRYKKMTVEKQSDQPKKKGNLAEKGFLGKRFSGKSNKKSLTSDRLGKSSETTLHDFKVLLSQQSPSTIGVQTKRSATEALLNNSGEFDTNNIPFADEDASDSNYGYFSRNKSNSSFRPASNTPTYISFDTIIEDREDLSSASSMESLKAGSMSSLKRTSRYTPEPTLFEDEPLIYQNKRGGKPPVDENAVMSILDSIRSTIKTMSGKSNEQSDDWKYGPAV